MAAIALPAARIAALLLIQAAKIAFIAYDNYKFKQAFDSREPTLPEDSDDPEDDEFLCRLKKIVKSLDVATPSEYYEMLTYEFQTALVLKTLMVRQTSAISTAHGYIPRLKRQYPVVARAIAAGIINELEMTSVYRTVFMDHMWMDFPIVFRWMPPPSLIDNEQPTESEKTNLLFKAAQIFFNNVTNGTPSQGCNYREFLDYTLYENALVIEACTSKFAINPFNAIPAHLIVYNKYGVYTSLDVSNSDITLAYAYGDKKPKPALSKPTTVKELIQSHHF